MLKLISLTNKTSGTQMTVKWRTQRTISTKLNTRETTTTATGQRERHKTIGYISENNASAKTTTTPNDKIIGFVD